MQKRCLPVLMDTLSGTTEVLMAVTVQSEKWVALLEAQALRVPMSLYFRDFNLAVD